jgi:hypothetical protein
MPNPLIVALVHSTQYSARSAVLGPTLQKKFSVKYEAQKKLNPC